MSILKTDNWHTWKCPQCKSEDGSFIEENYTNYVTGQVSFLEYMLCNKCKGKEFLPREYQVTTIKLSDVTEYFDVHRKKKWAGEIEIEVIP